MIASQKLQKRDAALLVIGHGATVDPHSAAPTWAHAETIAGWGCFARVAVGFWKVEPGIRPALAAIPEREIYVVPNFISEGYFTRTVIPRELGIPSGEEGSYLLPDGRTLHYCQPVGSHPAMTELILQRAREVAPGVREREAALIVVGHGTARHRNSSFAARHQAERIAAMGIYREVTAVYIDESPQVADWQRLTSAEAVIVVPFFIADGLHSFSDIPQLLGIPPLAGEGENRAAIFDGSPYSLGGRQLYYAGAVGTAERVAELMLEQVARFDPDAAAEEETLI